MYPREDSKSIQFRIFFSSRLLSVNLAIKYLKQWFLPVVSYGREILSLAQGEEH
jgi:hypothetical protein